MIADAALSGPRMTQHLSSSVAYTPDDFAIPRPTQQRFSRRRAFNRSYSAPYFKVWPNTKSDDDVKLLIYMRLQ